MRPVSEPHVFSPMTRDVTSRFKQSTGVAGAGGCAVRVIFPVPRVLLQARLVAERCRLAAAQRGCGGKILCCTG